MQKTNQAKKIIHCFVLIINCLSDSNNKMKKSSTIHHYDKSSLKKIICQHTNEKNINFAQNLRLLKSRLHIL